MNQLEGLGDKLDFTNAAGTELDVVGHALAPDFLLDQLLHGAQRFDGRKVQVTPVNERPQHLLQLRAGHLIAGHHPRLDHRVAFPVATLILVILLQRIEAQHQRARRTVGPQAHVDAEHETVDGHRVQRLDQPLAETNEKFLVIQRAFHADGFATLGVGENQVDVRRQIQLHGAELAHAEDDHLLRLAAAPAGRHAELLAMPRIQPLIGLIDAGIGHVREVAAGLDQIGLAGQVAPDDPHLVAGALATQGAAKLIVGFGRAHRCRDLRAQLTGRKAAVQFAGLHQLQQHQRVTHALFNHEVAGSGDAGKLRPAFRRPGRQAMVVVQSRDGSTERLLGTGDKRQENGGQFGKRREAHGLSLIGVRRAACSDSRKSTT